MIRQKFFRCALIAVIAIAACFVLPFLAYQFYCWQYCWFPIFGPQVEIVVSACRVPTLISISPNGRYIVYDAREHDLSGKRGAWLRDDLTGQERSLVKSGAGEFWLSDNLMLIGRGGGNDLKRWVFDVTDDSFVTLRWVHLIEGVTSRTRDGKLRFNNQVAQWFRDAERVYYLPRRHVAIALMRDFKQRPEQNFFLETPRSGARSGDEEAILAFLQENGIHYVEIFDNSENPYVSRKGKYIASGIRGGEVIFYDNQKVEIARVPAPHTGGFRHYGWASDDSGVFVQGYVGGSIFLFEPAGPSQPILKVNLPKEYLQPTSTP